MVLHQDYDKTKIEWLGALSEVNSPVPHNKDNFQITMAGNTWKQLMRICSVRNRSVSIAILKCIKQKELWGENEKILEKQKTNKTQAFGCCTEPCNAPVAKVQACSFSTNLVESVDSYSSHLTCKECLLAPLRAFPRMSVLSAILFICF